MTIQTEDEHFVPNLSQLRGVVEVRRPESGARPHTCCFLSMPSWELKQLRRSMKLTVPQMAGWLLVDQKNVIAWEHQGVPANHACLFFLRYLQYWVPRALAIKESRDCDPDFTL